MSSYRRGPALAAPFLALFAASVLSCNDQGLDGVDAHLGSTSQAVTGANDAPVLDITKSPTILPMNTTTAPSGAVGMLVSSLVDYAVPAGQVDNVTDLDPGEAEPSSLGIALINADASNGTWYFSTNGGTVWTAVGAVTDASALLLAADANTRLYYQANVAGNTPPAITFRAWDGTSGTAGSTANASVNGGTTAFSLASDTAPSAITFRNAQAAATTGATSLALTKPTNLAVNDLMIAAITITSNSITITGPAAPNAWTAAPFSVQTNGNQTFALFYRFATASDVAAANFTFSFSASVAGAGGITAFTGVNIGNPFNAYGAGATASSLNHTAPTLTASLGNTMLVTWHSYLSSGTWTAPTNMTKDVDTNSAGGTSPNGVSINADHLLLAAAGTTGTRTAVASNNADTGITATLVLRTANTAPALDVSKSPAFSVAEDAPAPTGSVGTALSTLIDYNTPSGGVDNFIDADGTTQFGIAITAVDSTNCTWWYTMDNGATAWKAIAPVTPTTALPLTADVAGNTRLYCQPTPLNFNGSVAGAITFRAWDMSAGTAGTPDDSTINGGTTAYSTATDTIGLTITPVNDAPTAQDLGTDETYTEDTPLNLIDIVVSDVDDPSTTNPALANITATLTLSNTAAGTLSTSGGATYNPATGIWTITGTITQVNTALAAVVFTPALNFNSNFNINTSISDNVAAAITDTKTMTGTPANDAPTATNLNQGETFTEDTPLDLTNIVVADVDSATITATLTLSNTAAGSLSTSGTATFTPATGVWTITDTIANVNTALAAVVFTPAANFDQNFTIGVVVSDGTLSATGTKAMTAMPVNDAPTLDATKAPALLAVSEDAGAPSGAVGTPVSALVDFATPAGQVDNVTDPDGGAQLGIAITATDTANLTAYYSINGGTTWQSLAGVTPGSARLLTAAAGNRIYVNAGTDVNGTFFNAITFRAWDVSAGANDTLADTTTNGGATAFSTLTDTASVVVTAVNDAPTATNLSAPETYQEDTALNLTDIVVSDIDSANVTVTLTLSNTAAGTLAASPATSGSATSSFSNSVWTATGPIANVNILLAAVTFTPALNFNSNFNILTSVTDGVASAIVGSKPMTGTAVNDAPSATNLSAAENYVEDTPLDLVNIVVSDVDSANVTVTLTLSNPAVGSLNTGTSGAVTSTYSAGTGVWTASGAIADVNALLAALTFTPAANSTTAFDIATSVTDNVATAITGLKPVSGTAVNDPPTATNLSTNETYVEGSNKDLVDIVVSDIDSNVVTVTLTLSNTAAGSLTTGSSGAATSTYNSNTGVWTVTGLIFNVNTLLSTVQYVPATNFNSTFTIATSVSDGPNTITGSKTMNGVAVNTPPSATNLSAAETYTEDTNKDLTDIVVTDADSASVTVTLTLSNPAAGALSTGTSGSTTSAFTAATGVWTASGPIAEVNALLAGVQFQPAQDFNAAFTIATSVTDGLSAAVTGTKNMTGVPVNDAPTATNLSAAEAYTEDTPVNLVDIVVADVDGGNLTATLTLSNPGAGAFNTATSGSVTSTFNAGTGAWTASGAIANVNTLLAGLTFTPAANFNTNFTVATSVTDGVAAALTGTKAFTGTAVNDPPVAVDDMATVPEGAQVAIDVVGNDTDVDDGVDAATVTFGTQPTHGTITAGANGSVSYHHDGTDTTSDSFTYTIKDAAGQVSNSATVTIAITPVADDADGDGVADDVDNCKDVANATQIDTDMDGMGDKCDPTPGGVDSGCGCSGGKDMTGSWPLLGIFGLFFRRRRRAKR